MSRYLKIKDDVDLTELEKFGFKPSKYKDTLMGFDEGSYDISVIVRDDLILNILSPEYDYSDNGVRVLTVLYDLFQARISRGDRRMKCKLLKDITFNDKILMGLKEGGRYNLHTDYVAENEIAMLIFDEDGDFIIKGIYSSVEEFLTVWEVEKV